MLFDLVEEAVLVDVLFLEDLVDVELFDLVDEADLVDFLFLEDLVDVLLFDLLDEADLVDVEVVFDLLLDALAYFVTVFVLVGVAPSTRTLTSAQFI